MVSIPPLVRCLFDINFTRKYRELNDYIQFRAPYLHCLQTMCVGSVVKCTLISQSERLTVAKLEQHRPNGQQPVLSAELPNSTLPFHFIAVLCQLHKAMPSVALSFNLRT